MSKIDLLDMLKRQAIAFRADRDYFKRNQHMHKVKETPAIDDIDAVLTGFINFIGMQQGVDYALYTKDLKERITVYF